MKFRVLVLIALALVGDVWVGDQSEVEAQMRPTREDAEAAFAERGYSPYAGLGYPTQVFWGDTHLHTGLSLDAGAFGNRLGLDDAYRFARGEEITSATGIRARLGRPLDFLVISDHSDGVGFFPLIAGGDPRFMKAEQGRLWNQMIKAGGQDAVSAALQMIDSFSRGEFPWAPNDPELARPVWDDVVAAAERFNEPGRFTALIGYEWTSLAPPGNNLHRVVIYRDGAVRTSQVLPFTATDSIDPEDLWEALRAYEEATGGRVLAIPHNGNISNGMMFDVETMDGQPLSRDYAERRARWEPLVEVTQIKGDGEAHPFLSPNDEFADYETWDVSNLNFSEPKTDDMLAGEYAREALKSGLEFEAALGVNPYKFGMIGSTDSHTGLATAEEENFFGKHSGSEPSPERIDHPVMSGADGAIMGWEQAASGYAAVWATDNTREAIFDAMQRKETYATTGPRMMVRLFGGWDFEAEDAHTRRPAEVGYAKGVPMGGDLSNRPGNGSPTFLVGALKDPLGANLDRIQIVKGWLDANGDAQEQVYDVAWAGDRRPGSDGKLPPVGNTVDVEGATWTNTIGGTELITVWEDPDFEPSRRAFYYARVLEIPTPRWTAYDANRYNMEVGDDVRMITQERAYTSPIWYTPTN
ncbi:MAG: DUF3604 domain-containing protein [Longimicrobiales bacterium]